MVRCDTTYTAAPPPDEDDFEPTTAELRHAFSDVLAQRAGPNRPLMTSAMRAKEEAARNKNKKQYDSVRIRVRFPDRTQLEQVFAHTATVHDVYALVDSVLQEQNAGEYVLFQSPPRRDYARTSGADAPTLLELGFAPAAVLSIQWMDVHRNGTHPLLTQPRTRLRPSKWNIWRLRAICLLPPRIQNRCLWYGSRGRRTLRTTQAMRAPSEKCPRYVRTAHPVVPRHRCEIVT